MPFWGPKAAFLHIKRHKFTIRTVSFLIVVLAVVRFATCKSEVSLQNFKQKLNFGHFSMGEKSV